MNQHKRNAFKFTPLSKDQTEDDKTEKENNNHGKCVLFWVGTFT